MRLLIVTNIHLPLSEDSSNGMERSSFEFLTHLAQNYETINKDMHVSVFTHKDSIIPQQFHKIPTDPEEVNDLYLRFGDGRNKWNIYSLEKEILNRIKIFHEFEVIHDLSSLFSCSLIASTFNIPYIRTVRLMPYHPAYSLTRNHTSYFIFLSLFQSNYLQLPRNNFSIIPDSIIVDSSLMFQVKKNYCVFIGRVEKRKGIELAINTSRKLNLPLFVIGRICDNDYYGSLKKQYCQNIEFVGEMKRRDLLQFLSEAKYLIWTPSVMEPSGRVTMEALKMRTNVICNNNGSMADIISQNKKDIQTIDVDGNQLYFIKTEDVSFEPANIFIQKHINIYINLLKNENIRNQ